MAKDLSGWSNSKLEYTVRTLEDAIVTLEAQMAFYHGQGEEHILVMQRDAMSAELANVRREYSSRSRQIELPWD